MQIIKAQCEKCGHERVIRTENPVKCSKCGHIPGTKIKTRRNVLTDKAVSEPLLNIALTCIVKRLSSSQKAILSDINGTRKNKYQIGKTVNFCHTQIHDAVQDLCTDGFLNQEETAITHGTQKMITYSLTPIAQALLPFIETKNIP